MIDWAGLVAALMAGLLGSVHCFGMCGGIAGALQLAVPKKSSVLTYLLSYNFGRILGYSILGLVAGLVSLSVAKTVGPEYGLNSLRIIGAVFLVLMAAYIGRWWMILSKFEQLGQKVFNPVRNFGKRWLPLSNPFQAVFLGIFWGFLPCGLVYSALAYSAASTNMTESVLRMTAFGIGTLPAVGLMGASAARLKTWLQKPAIKQLAAISLVVVAIWTVYPVIMQMLMSQGSHQHH